ncbi:MAG TPA: DNA alkylation repair protein [Puia sp.]|nr:DNA alkylation repair protein [Puia sp.]
MTVQDIMTELKSRGSESIKKILLKHGIREPLFGVKVEHLKIIQKKIKKDYQLAKDLYATGNADAMYLAGLIADDKKMTTADLQSWVRRAVSQNISEYIVPWVAAESNHGFELALQWIDSPEEYIAAAGWSTLGALVSLKDDSELDLSKLKSLLTRVVKNISTSKNRVKYAMNGFVIAVGSYVTALTETAIAAAKKIGTVSIEKNETACKVSDAADYILKIKERGSLGKKKKTVKC